MESVSFNHEKFDITYFGLVLAVCNVQEIIFIKKYLVYFFRISFFCEFLNILIIINLQNMGQILPFFFKSDWKNWEYNF